MKTRSGKEIAHWADKLVTDFPTLFKPGFYIECGKGWEPLLRQLCEKIAPKLKAPNDFFEGCFVVQVKEKFGGLRFYVAWSDTDIEKAIQEAEAESFKTCEECGQPGERRSKASGWQFTACEACAAKRK